MLAVTLMMIPPMWIVTLLGDAFVLYGMCHS